MPRPVRRRQSARRDAILPEVPEVSGPPKPLPPGGATSSTADSSTDADPIPEHIRRMLEAAYT
jgi:hypothetical protein